MAVTSTAPTAELILVAGNEFLDDALLGGREEGALDAEQKEAEDREGKIVEDERAEQERHERNLRPQGQDDDVALGEAVGDPAGGRRQQDKGQDDDCRQDGLDQLGGGIGVVMVVRKDLARHGRAESDEHELRGVVIKEDLHLYRDK